MATSVPPKSPHDIGDIGSALPAEAKGITKECALALEVLSSPAFEGTNLDATKVEQLFSSLQKLNDEQLLEGVKSLFPNLDALTGSDAATFHEFTTRLDLMVGRGVSEMVPALSVDGVTIICTEAGITFVGLREKELPEFIEYIADENLKQMVEGSDQALFCIAGDDLSSSRKRAEEKIESFIDALVPSEDDGIEPENPEPLNDPGESSLEASAEEEEVAEEEALEREQPVDLSGGPVLAKRTPSSRVDVSTVMRSMMVFAFVHKMGVSSRERIREQEQRAIEQKDQRRSERKRADELFETIKQAVKKHELRRHLIRKDAKQTSTAHTESYWSWARYEKRKSAGQVAPPPDAPTAKK